LRLIQSIPSPKAEPFKRWPAKVGRERISGVEKADKSALPTNIIHQEWTGLSVQAHK
jgi:DNA-damage-inducible protein D